MKLSAKIIDTASPQERGAEDAPDDELPESVGGPVCSRLLLKKPYIISIRL
jgi:hypothetical protein